MANYDEQVLGTGNINHPANQNELTDRQMLTEVYNVPSEVLEIFDRVEDERLRWEKINNINSNKVFVYFSFLKDIYQTLSSSENGHCIIVKNQIEDFLKK